LRTTVTVGSISHKRKKKIEKRERKNGGETFPNNATKERKRERERERERERRIERSIIHNPWYKSCINAKLNT
jgi:hypothetical protein